MKAVLYCRVSSKEQAQEGFSLDAQEKTGRDYARLKGLEIMRFWKMSESAWSKGRNEFNQMVEFLKNHPEIDHVIFDSPDRMTRNDFDKLKVSVLVKEHGKVIHFARTGKVISNKSGSDDEFMLDIEIAVAKKWSNDISRKASMGMREKAEQGFYPGWAPMGYLNDKVTRRIKVDSDVAPLVVHAFTLMASGQCSLDILVVRLFALGLRTREGGKVKKSSIEQMLKNPFYHGSFRWKGRIYSGNHEPLISKQLFDAAIAALTGRGHPAKPRSNGHLFNNLATCGICGCKIVGEMKKGQYLYYHCTFSKGRHAGIPYLGESRFVELFDRCVEQVTISDDCMKWLSDVIEDYQGDQVRLVDSRVVALNHQKAMLEDRLSRLYDHLCDGRLTPDVFGQKESEYRDELAKVVENLKGCEPERMVALSEVEETLELANRLYPTYMGFDAEQKAQMLRLLASNYTLDGATISATYRKPFSLFMDLSVRPVKLPRQDSNLRPAD